MSQILISSEIDSNSDSDLNGDTSGDEEDPALGDEAGAFIPVAIYTSFLYCKICLPNIQSIIALILILTQADILYTRLRTDELELQERYLYDLAHPLWLIDQGGGTSWIFYGAQLKRTHP